MIEIYTDGACKGNPGPGGYGVVVLINKKLIYSHHENSNNTTNNKEELKAIVHAFDKLKEWNQSIEAVIYTDSSYCCNICNNWIHKWNLNNWKNSKNKTIANKELIENLYNNYIGIFPFCQVEIKKVAGHAGIIGNELADAAACNNIKKFKQIMSENNIDSDLDYI